MADWYISSVNYAATPLWAASTAYNVGDFVRPTAPAANAETVHRCTTAGTTAATEPAWNTANNGTTTSNTAVFTNITGQSAYGWAGAAKSYWCLNGSTNARRATAGDRCFFGSDHTESIGTGAYGDFNASATSIYTFLSVSRAGSVPPVQADITYGASLATTVGTMTLDYWLYAEGIAFKSAQNINMQGGGVGCVTIVRGSLELAGNGYSLQANDPGFTLLDNTTIKFSATSSGINLASYNMELEWRNTANAILGTMPSRLFSGAAGGCRARLYGVDLSALPSGSAICPTSGSAAAQISLHNCKLSTAANVVPTGFSGPGGPGITIELVDCDSGSGNTRCERYDNRGALTTDTSIVLTGGASDGTTAFSRKMVSSTYTNALNHPLESFDIQVWNDTTGAPKTATVEIISSGSLNNNEVWLEVEYLGTGSYPVSQMASSYPGVLGVVAAVPTSSATWAVSPGTPVKQKLSVTFTPQMKGWLRGVVRLAKPSATLWYNPQLTIA